jgi:8-oxo-dGTP pyrophosphatase MutT (NUDIX family)
MSELPDPIPAATLILMRAGPAGGAAELLIIERAATMAFAAGALVFPGGRIDPDDHLTAQPYVGAFPDAAARIAAIRETIEETGIAPALLPVPDAAVAAALRDGLARGTPFSRLLVASGLRPDPGALTLFARWCPNFRETRRFDTLFFLCEAPSAQAAATADATEAVRLLWASAADVLAEAEAGRARLIFPTRRNLERLAGLPSLDAARSDAERHPAEKVVPWIEERGGRQWLCIPEGIGYPVTAELLETARRS